MTVTTRAAVAAAALAAAAATLLTGCGGGDTAAKDGRKPAAAANHTPGAAEDGEADKPSGSPTGPKLPASELTPATGSFTKREKSYLTDRVPKGMDPAAVLQIGQETCDRITRTAKRDREAVISALRSGEITGAEAAITHLCPEHLPLLEAAEKGSSG